MYTTVPSNWFYNVDPNNEKPYIVTGQPLERRSIYRIYNKSSATLPATQSMQYNSPVECSGKTPGFIGAIYGSCQSTNNSSQFF